MKTASTQTASRPRPGTRNGVLVDHEWLQAHLSDPGVRVVEVDVSAAAYGDWHIDGAVLWNIYADLKDADYRLVDTGALERLVARSGIGPDSTVVFYGYAPALGLWLMKLYGHRDVRILDCSRDSWRAEGYSWSAAASEPPTGSFRLDGEDSRLRADRTAVREAIGQPGTTLVDVRSAAEYQGERFWPSGGMEPGGRAGHVPSAVHQPIDGIYREDGSFRSAAELRPLFAPAVLNDRQELITYCTIGARAATTWFVLTHLIGRDRVRVYDGSWAEWGRTPGTPVEGARRLVEQDQDQVVPGPWPGRLGGARAYLPQVGTAVTVGGGQQVPGRGERDTVHAAAGGIGEGTGQPTARHIPQADLAVAVGRGQHGTPGTERHLIHAPAIGADERTDKPASGHVPQIDPSVAAGGGQDGTARTERHAVDGRAARDDVGAGGLAADHVPEVDTSVTAGGGQQVTAQAERDPVQAPAAPGDEGAGQFAPDQVP